MSALPRMLVASEGDRTVVVLPVGRHCSCGRMALMMVNRGGRTRCVTCDLLFREFNESPADEAVLAESVVTRAFTRAGSALVGLMGGRLT